METLRRHWYDFGGFFAILVLVFVFVRKGNLSSYQLLLWLSLLSLFLHQLEEYRFVGTFPGMLNRVMFHSDFPDRYPLNTNTSVIINVVVGWGVYFLAAMLAEKAIWLGMATILVSAGNFFAHTFVFNLKGKTFFNAGMFSSWLLFVPCVFFFFQIVYAENLISITDYFIGVPLGFVLNFIGILKLIDWLKNENTNYIFPQRNLLPEDRT